MATLHQLAPFYNTPEQLQLMKNFVGDKALPEIELDMNRIEQVILKEVWEKLPKGQMKNLENAIMDEVILQLHDGLDIGLKLLKAYFYILRISLNPSLNIMYKNIDFFILWCL